MLIVILILNNVSNFQPIVISPAFLISAFLLSLQAVLWETRLCRPSPEVILPVLTFQKFEA